MSEVYICNLDIEFDRRLGSDITTASENEQNNFQIEILLNTNLSFSDMSWKRKDALIKRNGKS